MRPIKFRAWHKKEKKMYYQNTRMSNICKFGFKGKQVSMHSPKGTPKGLKNDFFLMQFTGLKDKKGVEIYEGDIVDTRYGKYKVVWDDNNSGFEPFRGDINCPDSETESEVIGNIYENPELLK